VGKTYNNSLGKDKDRVRFLIGDSDTGDLILEDEEIEWLLTTEHNVWMAAAEAADKAASRLRRLGIQDLKVGETRIRYDRSLEINEKVARLRDRGRAHQLVNSGGLLVDDRTTMEGDSSLIQPGIKIGQHDYPGS
jgi:hypothetical protein